MREVERVVADGMTEVVLLGQTVNSYNDGEHDFADLLRAVGAVTGIRRVRFTSPHPNDFSERVIAAMAETPAVCEHVHLPMQSGSNAVLKRMLRRYTREGYLEVVARLRAAVPGLTFTTDIIVGFPGETETDFEETLSLVTEAGFDDAYTFRYSSGDGTPAVRLTDHVPDESASARLARLIEAVRARPGAGTWPGWERRTRCWSSGPPTAGTHARPDPGQPPGPGRSAHSRQSASITRCSSPERRARPSPDAVVARELALL